MIIFDFQTRNVGLQGQLPLWLTLLTLVVFGVPLSIGWVFAWRWLRLRSQAARRRLRSWARLVLVRILTERDGQL